MLNWHMVRPILSTINQLCWPILFGFVHLLFDVLFTIGFALDIKCDLMHSLEVNNGREISLDSWYATKLTTRSWWHVNYIVLFIASFYVNLPRNILGNALESRKSRTSTKSFLVLTVQWWWKSPAKKLFSKQVRSIRAARTFLIYLTAASPH